MEKSSHILGTFEAGMNNLRNDVLVMGSHALRNMANAINGVLQRDSDLCNLAIADDEEIDALEKSVDQKGFDVMLRFQPVASDLRMVISAMKISANLERVGDQAVSIARRGRKLNRTPELVEVAQLEPLYHKASEMLKDALKAYSEYDEALARDVHGRDKTLDLACKEFDALIGEKMVQQPQSVPAFLNLIFISRNLERVGDHAKNIAEDVTYITRAEDIRHIRPKEG